MHTKCQFILNNIAIRVFDVLHTIEEKEWRKEKQKTFIYRKTSNHK